MVLSNLFLIVFVTFLASLWYLAKYRINMYEFRMQYVLTMWEHFLCGTIAFWIFKGIQYATRVMLLLGYY